MRMTTPVSKYGEEALIRELGKILPDYSTDDLRIGIGDDCAVCARDEEWETLLKTDVVIENVHFLKGEDPKRVGWKALARPLSDIAAMGGLPEKALVTLIVSVGHSVEYLRELYEGLVHCAQTYGVMIVGGETARLPESGLIINVALTGRVEKGRAFLRSTACKGDLIYVTGELGRSFPSGHHLDFRPRIEEARLLMQLGLVHSMMDVSDGLVKDLPTLARASGLGFRLDPDSLPARYSASVEECLSDGEDYELLLTVPESAKDGLEAAWFASFPETRLTAIGVMTEDRELILSGVGGLGLPEELKGWDHFSSSISADYYAL